ncbi:hypothetical protein TEK04_18450 [Klenkia sp. LSe6-5]|uniref:Uncharacterized protein n=1 Tax=Klenkia sesuvii TaxID=3103137 RepID=A0ABU8DYW2_9ACTN
MSTTAFVRGMQDLVFPLVLVLIGEVVVQVSDWDRFWVLVVALVVGYTGRSLLRASAARAQTSTDD